MSCLTNVEPTMSIRKVPQQNIYTCAFDTMCIWCDKIINRGGQINIFAFKEFTGPLRDLLTRITVCNKIPIGVSILISKFIFTETGDIRGHRARGRHSYYIDDADGISPSNRLVWPAAAWCARWRFLMSRHPMGWSVLQTTNIEMKETICLNCCGKQQYVTRSGRKSTKPYNKNINTIAGSGFSGCDQYDRSFDGDIKDRDNVHVPSGDLKDFIVSDEELTSQYAIMDTFSEEEESEFSDYETSDGEDDEYIPCWDHSGDED